MTSEPGSPSPQEEMQANSHAVGQQSKANPATEAGSIDGVEPLDVATDMVCPRCSVELCGGRLDQFPVAFCKTCFGVLIDHDGVANVIGIRRAEYHGADRTPRPVDPQALETEGRCPNCGEHMEVYFYGGPGNVVMDGCRSCGMVWMDNGEITTIVRAPGLRRFYVA